MELEAQTRLGYTRLNLTFLPLIILIEGFVSIATEILSIRQLLPVAGGSVIVTSLVIGIFLLFLALGYHQGGRNITTAYTRLAQNFLNSAVLLGIGLSYPFITIFFFYFQKYINSHVIYPLTAYLLCVIAPLIYLLGQTLPIAMNMIRQQEKSGFISGGYVLSLNTIGSFLGSIVTSLVLLNYLGVAVTIFLNATLLAILCLFLTRSEKKFVSNIMIVSFALSIIYILNIQAEKVFFVRTNSYANYQIQSLPQEQAKLLIINEALSSRLDAHQKGFVYIEAIKKILFEQLKMRDKKILILGAGGFSLSAENGFNNDITYVDIDQKIKDVAVPHFIAQLNDHFRSDDARHFLKQTKNLFDAIVIDVYTDYKAIPAHLLTIEYMQLVKKHLSQDGVAIFNIVSNPMLTDLYSKRLDNTIRYVFNNCMVEPLRYANQVSNILYVCNANGLNDETVYTDDINRSTVDSFNW